MKKSKYKLSLTLGTQTIKSTGDTPVEALASLERPAKLSTKGILTISYGKKKATVLFTVPRLKRLFYPIAREAHAKQLATILK